MTGVIKKMFINFERGRGRERGSERIQSRLPAVSSEPDIGLDLTKSEIKTWAKTKSQVLNRLSHPGTPVWCPYKNRHQGCTYLGKGHVRTWWEDGLLQAEERPQQKPNLLSPWFWTSILENCDKINFFYLSLLVCDNLEWYP